MQGFPGTDAWIAMGIAAAVLAGMAFNVAGADLLMGGALAALLATGLLTPKDAFAGFGSEAVVSVAALFIVAAGIRETGGLDFFVRSVLGRPKRLASAEARLVLPVIGASAFVNNTPLVAMLVPVVSDWAKRIGFSPSKFLMPLSFAATLGGTCTLIGTSTNLVVVGMLATHAPDVHIGMFDLAQVGVPAALAGAAFLVFAPAWLLPDRAGVAAQSLGDPREYTVAMRVESNSPVVGQSIEQAGLRHLPGLFLTEIQREGESMVAVNPSRTIRADDVLVFAGVVDSVVDLRRIRGLVPATDQIAKLSESTRQRRLVEAVVGAQSSIAGTTVRASRFRTNFNAAIIAVHRHGERIQSKIGDIQLESGDVLLLEARPGFAERHRNDRTFALVSEVAGSEPPRHDRAWIGGLILAGMVLSNTLGLLPLSTAALLAAGAMLVTRCVTGEQARRSLEIPTLIAIACSFAVGLALDKTGAAGWIASGVVTAALPFGKAALLATLYLVTALMTNLVTNNAAAALMFPVVLSAAKVAGVDTRVAVMVLMLGASASFATPIGYQT
ncbi:MAG: SLC13 family permease, partial [Myxococcales bacterium]|nr:SLC13 family permease [Myxococcales bacterium]